MISIFIHCIITLLWQLSNYHHNYHTSIFSFILFFNISSRYNHIFTRIAISSLLSINISFCQFPVKIQLFSIFSFFPFFLYSHSSFESIKNDYCTQSYMVCCSCHRQQQWRYPPWWLLHWRYFSPLLPHSFLTSLIQIKIGAHNYQMSLRDLPSHLQMKYRYVHPLSCCE